VIGRLLGINPNTGVDHLANHAKYDDEEGTSGRRSILHPEAHEELIQHRLRAQTQSHPCTMGKIRYFISTKWQITMDNLADA
jgi:hypothetical protein